MPQILPHTVSIIIPCFNAGHYLVESVESARRQTWEQKEIIIVDDHSTDEQTKKELHSLSHQPGVRVLSVPHGRKGPSAARNVGIEAARGEFIFPLDADDKIDPTYISKAVAVLANKADVVICGAKVKFFGLRNHVWNQPECTYKNLLLEEYKLVCSCLYRRKDWERVGGYDESLVFREDMVFWIDLLEQGGEVVVLPEVLFFYRIRPRSLTSSIKGSPSESEKIAALYKARPDVFERYTPEFMNALAQHREEKAHRECLISWKIASPVLKLEWALRQKVKRLFGRA